MSKSKTIESYRPLFTIGIFFSLYALSSLIANPDHLLVHSRIFLTGFFMAFILGFVLSMSQYMLQVPPATNGETIFTSILVLFSLWPGQFKTALLAQIGFLIIFLLRRIQLTKRFPSGNFVYLPFALLLTPIATWFQFPLSLIYELLLFNFIIGVGSKMVPIISRTQAPFSPSYVENNSVKKHFTGAIILNFFILGEFYSSNLLFHILRAGSISLIIIMNFQLFKPLSVPSTIGHGIRIASWLMIVAKWCLLLPIGSPILWMHITYIGGFLLLTLLVASRVISSQLGIPIRTELNSKYLRGLYICLFLAAIFRVAFGLTGQGALFYLVVILCLAGIICWILDVRHRIATHHVSN